VPARAIPSVCGYEFGFLFPPLDCRPLLLPFVTSVPLSASDEDNLISTFGPFPLPPKPPVCSSLFIPPVLLAPPFRTRFSGFMTLPDSSKASVRVDDVTDQRVLYLQIFPPPTLEHLPICLRKRSCSPSTFFHTVFSFWILCGALCPPVPRVKTVHELQFAIPFKSIPSFPPITL